MMRKKPKPKKNNDKDFLKAIDEKVNKIHKEKEEKKGNLNQGENDVIFNKLVEEHYQRPEIKRIIQSKARDGDFWRAGIGDHWHWYKNEGDKSMLFDLSNDNDYNKLTSTHRTLYWTLNYFKPEVKEQYIQKGEKGRIGGRETTKYYSLGMDIDSIGSIQKADIRKAVEDAAQFFINQLIPYLPKSIHASFSGGGIYVLLHHRIFDTFSKDDEIQKKSDEFWYLIQNTFNRYIKEIEEEFFKTYPQHKGKVKLDALNNAKRQWKTILSIHKKYPYAVIPLDTNHVDINFEKAKIPVSNDVIKEAERWYSTYDNPDKAKMFFKMLSDKYGKEVIDRYNRRVEITDIEISETKIEEEFFPSCIKNILTAEKIDNGKTRSIALLAAFLGKCNWDPNSAEDLFEKKAQELSASTTNIFDSWFREMSCPECKKIQTKGGGYPSMMMGEVGICTPDKICEQILNPYMYAKYKLEKYKREQVEEALMGIKRYNEPSYVRVDRKVLEKVTIKGCNETDAFTRLYTIYRAYRGEGQRPFYIVTKGKDELLIGDQELYITPMPLHSESLEIFAKYPLPDRFETAGIATILKDQGIPLEKEDPSNKSKKDKKSKTLDEMLDDLSRLHANSGHKLFYKITTPIPLKELQQSHVDISTVIEAALSDGLEKDDDLIYLMRGQIPTIDNTGILEEEYMPFCPHTVIIAPTKAGKSTTGNKIGLVLTRPTPAGMLGFSDAQSKHQGLLNGITAPTFVDEVTENISDDSKVSQALLTYEERGNVTIARGQTTITKGYSALNYMGNPDPDIETQQWDMLSIFQSIINRLTHQFEAFGSRKAVILFKPDMQAVRGIPYPIKKSKKLEKITRTIQETYKKGFTRLFLNDKIRGWLYAPYDDEYTNIVNQFANNMEIPEIRGFIRGHKDSYRHGRGLALRQAWLDFLPEYVNTNRMDYDKVLGYAEKHLRIIQKINLMSFRNIQELAKDSKLLGSLYASRLDTQKPEYIGWFVKTMILWGRENTDWDVLTAVEALNPFFLKIMDREGTYNNIWKVLDPIVRNTDLANIQLKRYGVRIEKVGEQDFAFRIVDMELFKLLCESVEVFEVIDKGSIEPKESKEVVDSGKKEEPVENQPQKYQKPQQNPTEKEELIETLPQKHQKSQQIIVKILQDIPEFINPDNSEEVFSFSKEDVASLGLKTAKILIDRGLAEEIDTGGA